ncbi:MAG: cellulase family glycosylhydrolase [Roseiflexaceae bacterium]
MRVLLPAAALLLIALAAVTWADNAANRGVTYAPAPPPIAWADQRLGVNAFNIQFEPDPAAVTRTLELSRDLGAHYVRIQMPWEDIEQSGKGDFWDHKFDKSAWEKYDNIVATAQRLGLELIVRIDRPPLWARAQADATPEFQRGKQENGNSTGPPENYADYADFVGAVAARYRGRLRFYQLWNEPNLAYEWNWVLPQPERFVELLRLGYSAIKAADPNAIVLFPSLSPTDGLEPRIAPMSELEFLDRVYAAGGKQYFDIMSAQAYGLGQPPDEHRYVYLRKPASWVWSRPIDTRIDVSRLVLVREVMERNGDAGKAIWISEFGYVSDSPAITPEKRLNWGEPVSEEQKAAYLVGQIERARREWPWVGVMNLWFLRWGGYQEPDPQDPTPNFAIVGRDFTPLLAYQALKDYTTRGPVAGVGTHAWDHAAVQRLAVDSWQIRFEGTSLALYRMKAPLTVTIDGGAPVDFNPLVGGGVVTIAGQLPDGEHTAMLRGAAPPEAFLVGRTPPLPWLWALAPALIVAGLVLVGALAMRRLFG